MTSYFFAVWMAGAIAASAPLTPQIFEPGVLSTGFDDAHIAFTPDGKDVFILRSSPDFMHWTVLQTHRVGAGWTPLDVAPFSGRYDDGDVFVTTGGRQLYFISNRPDIEGDPARDNTDIFVMQRGVDGWDEPQRVAALSSPGDEWFPTVANSGTLYFGSERAGGFGKSDLWRARRTADGFAPPENLGPVLNSGDQEIEPLIDPDENWLIFAANGRGRPQSGYDLFISYNCPGGWTAPQRLPDGINSSGWDFGPSFSPDGGTFFFTSNRAVDRPDPTQKLDLASLHKWIGAPGNGLRDIYQVSARILDLSATTKCPPAPQSGVPQS